VRPCTAAPLTDITLYPRDARPQLYVIYVYRVSKKILVITDYSLNKNYYILAIFGKNIPGKWPFKFPPRPASASELPKEEILHYYLRHAVLYGRHSKDGGHELIFATFSDSPKLRGSCNWTTGQLDKLSPKMTKVWINELYVCYFNWGRWISKKWNLQEKGVEIARKGKFKKAVQFASVWISK